MFSVEGYLKYQEILYSRGYLTALCLLEKYGKLSCFVLTSSFWLVQKITQQMLLNIIPVIFSDGINRSYIYFIRQYLTSQLRLVICKNVLLDITVFVSLCFPYITNTKVFLNKRFCRVWMCTCVQP